MSTKKLWSHFFTFTETLDSDKYMTSLPLWVKRRRYRAVQNLNICRRKKHCVGLHLNNMVLKFTEFYLIFKVF